MTGKIETALLKNGYREMHGNGEKTGYRIYYEIMSSLVNAVLFVDINLYNEDFVKQFKNAMSLEMKRLGYTTHYMMVICVTGEEEKQYEESLVARQLCSDNPFCWVFDEKQELPIIYENQVEDFYGLKAILEKVGTYEEAETLKNEKSDDSGLTSQKGASFSEIVKNIKNLPKVTTALVLINVCVFIICTLTGTLLYNIGGSGLKLVESPIDLYRIITSLFLHMDMAHLFSNMVLLFFLGDVVEREFGSLVFACIFFFSGIWGCISTFIEEIVTNNNIVVVGASGAVFGVLGGLFALVLFKRINSKTMPAGRVFVVIVFSIYGGFTQANVANMAHLGGLIAGFLFGVVYCLLSRKSSERENL